MNVLKRLVRAAGIALLVVFLAGCPGKQTDELTRLCQRLESAQAQERVDTAQLIGLQGPLAMPAAPQLIKMLKSANPDERATAAQALGRVLIDPARHWRGTPRASEPDPFADQRRAQQRQAVTALVPLIEDKDDQVRSTAAVALSYLGCEAEPALRELERLAKHNQAARFAVNELKRLLARERARVAKSTTDVRP